MSEELLRRDLLAAREREEAYRLRLEQAVDLSQRLGAHTAALRELLEGEPTLSNVERTLRQVAMLSGQALGVSRTSIWLFDETRENLVRRIAIMGGAPGEDDEHVLPTSSCPAYIAAITSETLVAVEDATTDPRMEGLEGYLRAHDVTAMLDIAIAVPGGISGVVCHEHVGKERRCWRAEEKDFACNVAALVGLALEAQRRIVAERKAAALDAKYRHLVESLPVTLYSFDLRSGALDYLSPQIRDFGGWGASEWAAAGAVSAWLGRIDPLDRPLVEERFRAGVSYPLDPEIVYRVDCPDGRKRWVRDSCAVVRNPAGEPVAVQGILADVTALKEAELRGAEHERRFLALLENVELVSVIVGASGRIERVNDALVELSGRPREQLIGADWFETMLPEPDRTAARDAFLACVRGGGVTARREGPLTTKLGLRRVLWSDAFLRDPSGHASGMASIGVDITEREERERAAVEEIRSESLGRLAAGIAHDFNNMLTVLSTGLEALEDATVADPRELFSEMRAAMRQATGLTKALATYARHETLEPGPVAVDTLVEDLRPILTHLGRSLELDEDLGAPGVVVEIAATQLRQVVINLVANAAEATTGVGTGVRVSTTRRLLERDEAARLGLAASRSYVCITVADDGPGIAPAIASRIFEPFFTTKGEGKGTGIGLATCRRIVRDAKGAIDLESKPGCGSTFRVLLPEAKSTLRAAALQRTPTLPSSTNLLLVEDHPSIRRSLVTMLEDAGFQVVGVATLREAYDVLDRQRVDVLAVDDALPDGSGRAFAARVRIHYPKLKTLLVSAMAGSDDTEGFDATIAKPFTRGGLIATVHRMLEKP